MKAACNSYACLCPHEKHVSKSTDRESSRRVPLILGLEWGVGETDTAILRTKQTEKSSDVPRYIALASELFLQGTEMRDIKSL